MLKKMHSAWTIILVFSIVFFSSCGHDYSRYTREEEHVVSEYINTDDVKYHTSICVCGYEKTGKHTFSEEDISSIYLMEYEGSDYFVVSAKCGECGTEGTIYRQLDTHIPIVESTNKIIREVSDGEIIEKLKDTIKRGDYDDCIGEKGTVIWFCSVLNDEKTCFYEINE